MQITQKSNAGEVLIVKKTFTSSNIPNNTQTGGALTGAASGELVLEKMILQTDSTGIAGPTNLEVSLDNVKGLTGAGAPFMSGAISDLGANKTVVYQSETIGETFPVVVESGKKVYIHGDNAAGTGAGTVDIWLYFRRVTNGASIAAA